MYHYTESGLQNVWLCNGYTKGKSASYGETVAIHDVDGLHKAIGRALAANPYLTGSELRFLRKEMDLSQAALARLCGTSEQSVSMWERKGHIPKSADRLVRLIYQSHVNGDVQVRQIIERISSMDHRQHEKLRFEDKGGVWKEAA